MDLVSVEFDKEKRIGKVEVNGYPLFIESQCDNLGALKYQFIDWISKQFDESIGRTLGIYFPYIIGNMTFYSLSEIEKYIEGTQCQMDGGRNERANNF